MVALAAMRLTCPIALENIDALVELESHSAENYWGREDICDIIRRPKNVVLTVKVGLDFAGVLYYQLKRKSIQILNLVVHQKYRRLGIGSLLLDLLKNKLDPQGRTNLVYEIRESNLEGQLFLRTNGLVATSVERNYFQDLWHETSQEVEDAYRFVFVKGSL